MIEIRLRYDRSKKKSKCEKDNHPYNVYGKDEEQIKNMKVIVIND